MFQHIDELCYSWVTTWKEPSLTETHSYFYYSVTVFIALFMLTFIFLIAEKKFWLPNVEFLLGLGKKLLNEKEIWFINQYK